MDVEEGEEVQAESLRTAFNCTNSSSYYNCILLQVAKIFAKRPCLVLVLTLSIALILTWMGLAQYGFPEFDNPYLGFEARFTSIANRLVTLDNFRREVNRLQLLENYPGEKITEREWKRRKRRSHKITDDVHHSHSLKENSVCTILPLEEYGRIALELENPSEPFSLEVLSLICFFQKLLEELPVYSELCEHDEEKQCCSMWSLPNYITLFSNKTDCIDLQEKDIHKFQKTLNNCVEIYQNGTQQEDCTFRRASCPEVCYVDGLLHNAYSYTIDNSYVVMNETKFTMIIVPIAKSNQHSPLLQYFQDQIHSIQMPGSKLSLAGYDFGGKDAVFRNYLIWDLKYVVIASVIIFLIVCFYTHSIFVTLISFSVLILSLGVSYFSYFCIFSINYFPFMNMLVAIVILGIGTDGTLIFSIVWQRQRATHQVLTKNIKIQLMMSVLKETTVTLLITTCTTAGAFLASLNSSITTIRCFSIFAGTAIITSFLLIYLCVPTALLLGDLVWTSFYSMLLSSPQIKGKFLTKFLQFYQKIQILESIIPSTTLLTSKIQLLLQSTKFWLVSFCIFFGVLIWSIVAIIVYPGIQLPSSEQFQLLSASHPIEKYDTEIEPHFMDINTRLSQDDTKMTLYFIWGLRPIDTGHGLDPYDDGKLQFDSTFSLASKPNQKWMRKTCKKLQSSSFYDLTLNSAIGTNYDTCFIETMIKWMKRDCDKPYFLGGIGKNNILNTTKTRINTPSYEPCCKISKFPYEPKVFIKCLGLAARDVYRTPAFYFHPDIAGPKFFPVHINDEEDDDEDQNLKLNSSGGQLATFALRVRTNVSFSLVYDKINAFYKKVESFFDEIMKNSKNVPTGLGNGFVISAHWDYYDLQNCLVHETWQSLLLSIGLCFVLLWMASCSFAIAVGAVFTIFATVLVTCGILIQFFSWKLGVFEAIAVTVAVGLSDFTTHHTIEFSKCKSVAKMTSPTFFSASTTIIMGLSMLLFSNVLVYQQIGSFFFVLVVVSWLYSVFLLSPMLTVFDKLAKLVCEGFKYVFCNSADIPANINLVQEDAEIATPAQPSLILGDENDNDEDTNSDSNFIVSKDFSNAVEDNHEDTVRVRASTTLKSTPSFNTKNNAPEKKSGIMMEKWKLLKKFAQETTV